MELLTKDEVAKELKVTVRTVERYIEIGHLKKYKNGRSVRIARSDFNTFFKRHWMASKESA
jgi:excisionase family DNA binding protein